MSGSVHPYAQPSAMGIDAAGRAFGCGPEDFFLTKLLGNCQRRARHWTLTFDLPLCSRLIMSGDVRPIGFVDGIRDVDHPLNLYRPAPPTGRAPKKRIICGAPTKRSGPCFNPVKLAGSRCHLHTERPPPPPPGGLGPIAAKTSAPLKRLWRRASPILRPAAEAGAAAVSGIAVVAGAIAAIALAYGAIVLLFGLLGSGLVILKMAAY